LAVAAGRLDASGTDAKGAPSTYAISEADAFE
jgi:hypothetical protein